MKGLELARSYYETYGRAMIHERFGAYENRITVGLAGEGSECFGFDDEYSTDHDFGPAFCMWADPEVIKEIGMSLQEAYESLPKQHCGVAVRRDTRMTGHRTGVWESGDFYRRFLGMPDGPEDLMDWLRLPDSYLAVAANGAMFVDGEGRFLAIRKKLLAGYPEDVRIKKMVARAAVMSQAGQYNFPRCLNRGEAVAASLALSEFINHGMSMIYLLNRSYAPFYKWKHRGMERLKILTETRQMFAQLICERLTAEEKQAVIEDICRLVSEEWMRQGLISQSDSFLQNSLDELMSKIQDPRLRSMHWLQG